MIKKNYEVDPQVPLPQGLTPQHVVRAVTFIEREAGHWLDLWYEQQNLFSAIVGILGIRALESMVAINL
jgi:hypothetical protein